MSTTSLSKKLTDTYDWALRTYAQDRDPATLYVAKQSAREAVDGEISRVSKALAQAPTEKESAVISQLSGRSSMTLAELDGILGTYSAHPVQRAALDAAERAGIIKQGSTTELEDELAALQGRADFIPDAFSPFKMDKAASSEGYRAMMRNRLVDFGGALETGNPTRDFISMLEEAGK